MSKVSFVKCSKEQLEKMVPIGERIKVEELWLTEDGKIYFIKEEVDELEKLRRELLEEFEIEKRPL